MITCISYQVGKLTVESSSLNRIIDNGYVKGTETRDYISREKVAYQCIQIESKYFTDQHHLFGYRMFLSCATSNNNWIVNINPCKFYVRIWFRHGWKLLPFHLIIKHVNIAVDHLGKEHSELRSKKKKHSYSLTKKSWLEASQPYKFNYISAYLITIF